MKLKLDKSKLAIKNIGIEKIALIILAGIMLILCSFGGEKKEKDISDNVVNESSTNENYTASMERKLEELLGHVEGVGNVKVMITIKATGEKNILTEKPYSKSSLKEEDGSGGTRNEEDMSMDCNTVYITDESGNTIPYVINESTPLIEGVAVIAEGGGDASVKEKIINVIKSLFNIEANKISISKMK